MTLTNDTCKMEARITKIETKQEALEEIMESYSEALKENTKSIQELCRVMVRHDEMLQQQEESFATRNALLTGVTVGIVVLLIDGLIHII